MTSFGSLTSIKTLSSVGASVIFLTSLYFNVGASQKESEKFNFVDVLRDLFNIIDGFDDILVDAVAVITFVTGVLVITFIILCVVVNIVLIFLH